MRPAALLLLVPVAALAGAQDPGIGLLAYALLEPGVAEDSLEIRSFDVTDATHRHELRWNANGQEGRVEMRIVAVANETTLLARGYEAGGAVASAARFEPAADSHRLEVALQGFAGHIEIGVWDLDAPRDPSAVREGPADGTAQGARASGTAPWLDLSLLLEVGGLSITGGLGAYGIYALRRRRRRLADRIERVDAASKAPSGERRERLLALREEFKGALRAQKLEEEHFLVLDARVRDALERDERM